MDSGKFYDKVGLLSLGDAEYMRFEKTYEHILGTGSLLDAGCSDGHWLGILSERSELELYGVDASGMAIEAATGYLDGRGVQLSVSDITDLPYGNGKFGQVTSLEVIEHIPDWRKALGELTRVASERVVITVPYKQRLIKADCRKCGTTAYLGGHLHIFTEEDFKSANVRGHMTFDTIPQHYDASYFIKRTAATVAGKLSGSANGKGAKDGFTERTIVCPKCYADTGHKKYMARALRRISKLADGSPEWLLVQIDK